MTLMQRRRALMEVKGGANNPMVLTLGIDFFMREGNAASLLGNFTSSWRSGFSSTRRGCFSNLQVDGVPEVSKLGDGNTGTFYPIPIPRGATKVKSFTVDKQVDVSLTYGYWNGSTISGLSSQNWVPMANLDVTGKNFFVFCFRVDSSNTAFDASNTPTSVVIEFE